MSIYDITVKDLTGKPVQMRQYEGKTLLIINTATGCGFTPQYEGLQALYEKYQEQGLVILDFPCNQFGKQAPGSAEEIKEFCQLNYKTSFPQFAKVDVNGKNEDSLFAFLKKEQSGIFNRKIKWNFTKFLVDKQGNVVDRFGPTSKPQKIEKIILEIL